MPCTKCEEGKYKWGKTGECEYPTKEACESANHKYNKMRPTPLGKKTYEEYEKELKEYNLSSAYKVELKDAKTLDKLVSKADGVIKKIAEAKKKWAAQLKETRAAKKLQKSTEKAYDNWEKEEKKLIASAEDEYWDKEEALKVKLNKRREQIDEKHKERLDATVKADKDFVTINEKYERLHNDFSDATSDADDLWADLKTEINNFEGALKELGIDASSSKLNEYKAVLQRVIKAYDSYEDEPTFRND